MTDEQLAELEDLTNTLMVAATSDDFDAGTRALAVVQLETALRLRWEAEQEARRAPVYFTAAVVAEAMGRTPRHIGRWCEDPLVIPGAIKGPRGEWLIPAAWLDEHPERVAAITILDRLPTSASDEDEDE